MFEEKLAANVVRLRPQAEEAAASDLRTLPPSASGEGEGAWPEVDAEKAARRAEKRLRELREPLEPWDRYSALRHTLDEARKLEDLADHKARFAMILMGALNALLLVIAFSGAPGALAAASRPWVTAYLVLYGLSILYFSLEAIEALRPRSVERALPHPGAAGAELHPAGLRHHDDVLRRDHHAYLEAWRQVCVEQINSEVALQVHKQAQVNQAKHRALTRLYAALRVMTLLMAGLVLILVMGGSGEVLPRPAGAPGSSGTTPTAPGIPLDRLFSRP